MSDRQLYLLSPYRLPTHSQIHLNAEEAACWLNGLAALWHPAALAGAARPPEVSSSYDHEFPAAGFLYAAPETPQLFQPDDWPDRVRAAGAARFVASADRADTLAGAVQALRQLGAADHLLDLPAEAVQPFLGLGFGHAVVDMLFEAMDHERLLDADGFWADVQAAAADPHNAHGPLSAAAEKLQQARDALYPSAIHWLDFWLPGPGEADAPATLAAGLPLNLIAAADWLDRLRADRPDVFERVKAAAAGANGPPQLEVCCGAAVERDDVYLPVESQLWNLRTARTRAADLLGGAEVTVFARRTTAFHPQLPGWLQSAGFTHAVLLAFDGAVAPTFRSTVVNWPSPEGRQVDAFVRQPLPADEATTFFNLVYHLRQTLTQDTAPTLALLHRGKPPAAGYEDVVALSRLAPVFGRWLRLSDYFRDALAGEYVSPPAADEFFADALDARVQAKTPSPVSGFAAHARARRRLDAAWTYAGLYAGLTRNAAGEFVADLTRAEDEFEAGRAGGVSPPGLEDDQNRGADAPRWPEQDAAKRLADRLLARAAGGPGYLLLNPCSFTRRVALELPGEAGPFAVEGPVKAAQTDPDAARLVVEVPGLGFAWVGRGGTTPARGKLKSAEGAVVRNEFFEAEVDAATGGLKALRDPRGRANRVGQQLVFNPGSSMRADSVRATFAGPALGEVVSEGVLLNAHAEEIARFRQRFRAWAGRPVLELRVELTPTRPPTGYGWHAYYGARFAWRDERATFLRGVNGVATVSAHPRPVSPDFVELRLGREGTTLFTGGLPFLQRQGGRMLDVVLVPEGETATAFDLALALDRDNPAQTALGLVSPVAVVPAEKGPPHVGPGGWLFHLDMPNLLVTTLRPAPAEPESNRGAGVVAQVVEVASFGGAAELRCARDPLGALLLDSGHGAAMRLGVSGDAVQLDVTAGDLARVRVEFDPVG